jgi:hypothetical protein
MSFIKIIILIIGIIILNSCEKKPFDPRNKYIGEYSFTTTIRDYNVQCCDSNNISCCPITFKINYNGNIILGSNNEIIIEFVPQENYISNWIISDSQRIVDGKLYNKIEEGNLAIEINKNGDVVFGISNGSLKNYVGTFTYNVRGKRL